jgi:hypothetical protein
VVDSQSGESLSRSAAGTDQSCQTIGQNLHDSSDKQNNHPPDGINNRTDRQHLQKYISSMLPVQDYKSLKRSLQIKAEDTTQLGKARETATVVFN